MLFRSYLQLDNLRLRSNDIRSSLSVTSNYKVNTIEVVNTGGNRGIADNSVLPNIITPNSVPYLRLMPGIYTRNGIAEDYFQVGTSKIDDVIANNANQNTHNKVVIGRVNDEDNTASYTFIEQDYSPSSGVTSIFNKLTPFSEKPTDINYNTTYREIGGIYSYGNIGCSDKILNQWSGRDSNSGPYQSDAEWVRFTKFRYDKDNDQQFGGTNTTGHKKKYGDTFNIEFNTTVKNRRANQIIWNYMDGNPENAQPLKIGRAHV